MFGLSRQRQLKLFPPGGGRLLRAAINEVERGAIENRIGDVDGHQGFSNGMLTAQFSQVNVV